ncbi:MAG: alpha/beta hydrolase [Proteobacteria bacterium]|nr:alpha/beta hydrolase [Pseudomonadota bacterium]
MPDGAYLFRGQPVHHSVVGDGPPLVFVHGTPFSSHVWHRIAPHFTDRYRVHRYDLLGYGRSHKSAGQDVSLGVQDVLLAELFAHWGLEHATVVAHDFGGATALRAHLLQGLEYERLMLIDPVAVSPWGSPFVRHVRDHENAFARAPAYIHDAIVSAYIRGAAHRRLSDAELAPYVEPWSGTDGQAAFYRQIAQMDQRYTDEIESRLSAVRCPTVILWGAQDQWIPLERGRKLQQLITGSQLHEVADAGHLVQEDSPEAIVAALFGFLPRQQVNS